MTIDRLRASDKRHHTPPHECILGDNLDSHALEIDGQSSLELICAHFLRSSALLEKEMSEGVVNGRER